MKAFFIAIFTFCFACAIQAQNRVEISVTDVKDQHPLQSVTIRFKSGASGITDSNGKAVLQVATGQQAVKLSITGYESKDTSVVITAGKVLNIAMQPEQDELEEVVVVASTRNNQSIENGPMKVEVLGLEEMTEEAGLKPGNIGSILGDLSGVQIQQSSATSGNSNVRIQGLDGRYTQTLRDGMPMYDGFSGNFGILTIPPLDLKQIELIKGSASTLYGGGAIAGLVNLISKRPTNKQELDVLLNYTTLKEFNANTYTAKRGTKWGYNLFAGYNRQEKVDVDKDGLSDLPDAKSFIFHPKVFFYPTAKTLLSVGYSGAFDDRIGGDMQVLKKQPDATHQYFEGNKTQRHTGEYLFEQFFSSDVKLTIKGIVSNFTRDNTTNKYFVSSSQLSYYNEASVYLPFGKNNLVAGINLTGQDYNTRLPDNASLKNQAGHTLGAFAQYDQRLGDATTLEGGMRIDHHNQYGYFALPRIALFHRFNEHWASRAGFGMGYKTPNPLVEQNIDYSVLDLLPVNANIKAEKSYGYNAEFNYKKEWDKHVTLFINQAFFYTTISSPVIFTANGSGKIELMNAGSSTTSKGLDTYIKLDVHDWELYAGYTLTDARNTYLTGNNFIPLTPKHRFAFVVANDISEELTAGLEGSYTGSQFRYDGSSTTSYFFMAAMVKYAIDKHATLVLNCENLLDYRMNKVERVYTGTITDPVFKPLWAPIDGRAVNLSVRWKL
ncbi:TonB-dependent receptor [Mucilaginibacter auburnensis]|uniref:Iron complex outermembrane receptor protein/outer membrane receptor for ferrienterochelin and colicins n=1 Tax=Mucilaginibacter auburnensis TaxID=1457233 RepID=A0A2H9VQ59_9SPHI|nr:TonB-dependent receptor [Mucilaginibacter auburnensis]PJJ80420.1 iron complex outermembrane receptor protein/outer membrane receptor for ferrienterochelin and colicins [Mucilaginibacter auburnensis]